MSIYQFPPYRFNTDTRELVSGENDEDSQYLRKKVADVLTYLLENRDRVVSKEELLSNIWEHGEYRESSLLQSVRELRRLFGEAAHTPTFIRTVHLKGYEWIFEDVIEISAEELAFQQPDPSTNAALNATAAHLGQRKQATSAKAHSSKLFRSGGIAFILLIVALTGVYWASDVFSPPQQYEHELKSHAIAVLPFVNDTGDSELQWLELGYSDMFADGLRQVSTLPVIPTYHVQGTMAQHDMDRRLNSSEEIIELLTAMNAQFALTSTISKDGEHLRFNYRIYDSKGKHLSGSIQFPNSPSSLASLVMHISQRLSPPLTHYNKEFELSFDDYQSQQDYANGIQALHKQGAKLARHYFEAAYLRESSNLAIKAKLAYTQFLMGDWQEAYTLYSSALANVIPSKHKFLMCSIYTNFAELLIEMGKLDEAENAIEAGLALSDSTNQRYNKAELVRQQAYLFLAQGRRQQYHQKLKEANQLSQPFESTEIEADALYYLGSPSNYGLEVDPDVNLKANQEKLTKALTYYRQLENKRGEALTLLAIGHNYYFDVATRQNALLQAEQIFRDTGNLFNLIDTLNYLAYFYVQYHLGEKSQRYADEGYQLAVQLGDNNRINQLLFSRALALLDQGMDRGEGSNQDHVLAARTLFEQVLKIKKNEGASSMCSDATLLLGWANAELGESGEALALMNKALEGYRRDDYIASAAFAFSSITDELARTQQWQAIIDVNQSAKQQERTDLSGRYLARAYYELGKQDKAYETLLTVKQDFPDKWLVDDESRLTLYQPNGESMYSTKPVLGNELSSRLQYCDSFWNTDEKQALLP